MKRSGRDGHPRESIIARPAASNVRTSTTSMTFESTLVNMPHSRRAVRPRCTDTTPAEMETLTFLQWLLSTYCKDCLRIQRIQNWQRWGTLGAVGGDKGGIVWKRQKKVPGCNGRTLVRTSSCYQGCLRVIFIPHRKVQDTLRPVSMMDCM